MTEQNEKDKNIYIFLKRVEELGKGEKAALKRSLGITLSAAGGGAVSAFYSTLPEGVPIRDEQLYFFVATCLCYFKDNGIQQQNFIKCLLNIKKAEDMGCIDNRLMYLLDAKISNDGNFILKLSRLIKITKQKGLKPDFARLLKDLLLWEHPEKYVQSNWAREFYACNLKENNKNITEETKNVI